MHAVPCGVGYFSRKHLKVKSRGRKKEEKPRHATPCYAEHRWGILVVNIMDWDAVVARREAEACYAVLRWALWGI